MYADGTTDRRKNIFCKYGSDYYIGNYTYEDEKSDTPVIQWSKSDETEIMPFEVGRRVIKIPDATDAVTGYKCTKRDGGYYDESVTIDGVQYIYVSDGSGLKGIMCKQVCYVEIKGITRCPASNDFPEPNIK